MQIKVNTSENDCWNTDEIVCPYCGAVHGDSWEFGKGEDIGEMNCDHCGREFIATRNIKTTYSSRPAGTKPYVDWEEGDIFDDGITEDEAEKWANQNGEKPCEVVEQVHSWSEDYDGNVHILGREQKIKPIKKPCPYCDETPEPMIKKYEAERGGIMPCGMEIPGGFIYSKEYVAWLEAKANISDEAIEAFQKLIRNQCDEISALKEQLRWRLVSERPEKDGWYLCKVLYVNDTIGEETVHFDGERFVFSNVVKWLPIPPAPEGE